jgi:peroxiredoxin
LPSLESLHQRFKGKTFALIGIDIEESKDTVLKSVRKHGLTFVNLLDTDGQVAMMYGVRSTPVKFLIDKEGNMAAAALGYKDWDQEDVHSLIRQLIESK